MKTCTWLQEDEDSDTWNTDCGNCFVINDGSPEDNKMEYCCYCGKQLITEKCIDPTPWCSGCGAMTKGKCNCGPIADND